MAHDPHDHVHRLIRSMSRAEKRYFKLYAGRHMLNGQSHYCDLFDAISVMETYDETALYVKFAGAPFLRRFTVIKHRLYDSILASLEAYHANNSVDSRLRSALHQIGILYQRGLNKDAERMLRNLKQTASVHGKQWASLEAIEWERRLMERSNYEGIDDQDLSASLDEARLLREACELQDRLWGLKSRAFMLLYRQGKARDARTLEQIHALAKHPLLAEDGPHSTPRARFMRHHVLGSIAYATNELQLCRFHLTTNQALLSEHVAIFKEEPNLELSVASNLAHINMRLGRYEEALEGLKRIKRLPLQMAEAPNADLELKIFSMTANLEISILCRTGDFAKAVDRLPGIAKEIERYDERLSGIRRAGIRFQAAWVHFANGDLDSAAKWCEDLLNERGVEAHEEVFALGRVLRLLIQSEMAKYELLRYEVRNVERFLKGHGRYHRFEQAMVRYVKACVAEPSGTARHAAQLARALQALENDPMERAIFDHFDPIVYALSRCGNGPMREIAVRRAAEAAEQGRTRTPGKRSAA